MTLDQRFPTLADLRRAAQRRIPAYLWDYLEGGTGNESARHRAEEALDRLCMMPRALCPAPQPELSTTLFGQRYDAPFGIAPVGMGGAVWPDAEHLLARVAARAGIPYCLSTVAAATPESVGPDSGTSGWFQLYAPATGELRRDILDRARRAGFGVLVFTVDVPVLSRRPRELRQRLENPMRLTPRILAQSAMRPAWAWQMLGRPIPAPRLFDKYAAGTVAAPGDKHIGLTMRTVPDRAYLDALRAEWDGPLVIKGVLDPESVPGYLDAGADGIWVSSHGGRQFEAAPAPLDMLPAIRAATPADIPVIFDTGLRSGTDILRAHALGADFTMLGRSFFWGLGAAGSAGAEHVVHVLRQELVTDMAQLGIDRPIEARTRVAATP